jgi:hypothetical protein
MASTHTMVVNKVGQLAGRHNFCIRALIEVIFAPLERSQSVENCQGVGKSFGQILTPKNVI